MLDLVELNEGLKKLGVLFGVTEVTSERDGVLFENIQAASSDHVKQFF